MEKTNKIKALIKFYQCKLDNKYYVTESERIYLEEKIKHFKKILGVE